MARLISYTANQVNGRLATTEVAQRIAQKMARIKATSIRNQEARNSPLSPTKGGWDLLHGFRPRRSRRRRRVGGGRSRCIALGKMRPRAAPRTEREEGRRGGHRRSGHRGDNGTDAGRTYKSRLGRALRCGLRDQPTHYFCSLHVFVLSIGWIRDQS